ncbi:DUF3037 domain-containing protein [Microbacterium elymi]|uniref:DUF3037 domain-containing protein n=1 Tax=Microbacterium elymi TaxID=2909587 RepID=A0ABY5NLE9_9MICO|nr:DUF3037 domain-containing protein [Microbacterium elymi]UUT36005.1 DUF3037 domain-containing protein [Microbacterium elymi]
MSAAYLYWLVRYVPDVARGERVNVAVIVGRDSGDWAVRVAPNLRRASRLGGDAGAIRPWLDRLQRSIDDYERPPLHLFTSPDDVRVTRAWLELVSHRFNNVLQISPATPVEAESAADGADFLFALLVATPEVANRSRTRTRIISDLAQLYERTANLEVGESLLSRPRAVIGRQRGRFDFAVIDDHVDQLSQVFAFDVQDVDSLEQQLQSWNFVVGCLRSDGAEVSAHGVTTRADAAVPIAVAFQEPPAGQSARHGEVFAAAREAWVSLGVRAIPSTELDQIPREARELIAA